MKISAEFVISEIEIAANGLNFHGFSNRGSVSKLTRFSRLVRKNDSGQDEAHDVNLVVRAIVAYRHEVDELPEGMGGQLIFHGCGDFDLRSGDVLMEDGS